MDSILAHTRGFLQLGKSIRRWECLLAYLLPLGYALSAAEEMKRLLLLNAAFQLCVFAVVVQIPVAVTQKMAYVDIGWPLGLVVLGATGMHFGRGAYLRRLLGCGCMMLHGARMLIGMRMRIIALEYCWLIVAVTGALVLFYPYNFKSGDLSRYQYAKHRWVEHEGLSEALWPIKAQMDTLIQCFANCLVLACPVLLAASNPLVAFHPLEAAGVAMWLLSWAMENIADGQKVLFLHDCKTMKKERSSPEASAELRSAVLGFKPFDSSRYWLWTRCRHPNYFFEWASWISFATIGFGSVATKHRWLKGGEDTYTTFLLVATLLLMVRFFYDCLVYWTGAAPAEQQSVRKRPLYEEYQRRTRVFFPFPLPEWLVSHHRTPRWPLTENEKAQLLRDRKERDAAGRAFGVQDSPLPSGSTTGGARIRKKTSN